MEPEGNEFVASKKRRRSSLFVDRRSRIFHDDDSQGATQTEPAACETDINAGEIQKYILSTKQRYRKWRSYEKEVGLKLEAARNAKPLHFDEKTLEESLNVEDRSFMKEAEDFLKRRFELSKEAASVTSRLEALVDQYEFNKQLLDVVYTDLAKLHQTIIAKAVYDHQEMINLKIGRLRISSEFPFSNGAPQILAYNSDSE